MRKTETFHTDNTGFARAMAFVQQFLTDCGLEKKARIKAKLVVEEILGSLMAHRRGDDMRISAHSLLGTVTIELAVKGEQFSLTENMKSAELPKDDVIDADAQDVLRNIMLRSMTDDLKYRHRDGVNYVRVTLIKSKHAFLWQTLGAMLAAIVVGLILSAAAPASFNAALSANLLSPVKTMYLNALKMVVAPVVFFSIVACIVQFSDLSALGRIGGKTLALYLCTTFIAVGVGIGSFYLFQPGSANLVEMAADASAITSKTMNVSIRDTIVGIIPSNFLGPFLESNMLQLIFLAVVCGVAAGLIGKYSAMLTDLFQACNDLFLKITTLFIKVMPVAVFCSITSMMLSMGAPGIPGSGLICLSVLLTQMNVPVEAIGLVMGIDSLIGMFRCMSNCLGDVAVTSIVAKSEGQMDMEVYRQ